MVDINAGNALFFVFCGGLVLSLVVLAIYGVALQRKAVKTQDAAMVKMYESFAMAHESTQAQKEMLDLMKRAVALQEETNRLLAAIAEGKEPK